ncbi:hypothetical protein EC973_009474 [Apophysomyces ossiformis]|uniref:Uncharacterized protein n=1 Tax=Apophysomyces ossiformis TaxID=679940 RepID=A0A8H7ENF5_9FUNG|nr:hypothetical protein EC973_009474 [Apophysomyces ossiformis]
MGLITHYFDRTSFKEWNVIEAISCYKKLLNLPLLEICAIIRKDMEHYYESQNCKPNEKARNGFLDELKTYESLLEQQEPVHVHGIENNFGSVTQSILASSSSPSPSTPSMNICGQNRPIAQCEHMAFSQNDVSVQEGQRKDADLEFSSEDDLHFASDITIDYHADRTAEFYLDNVPLDSQPADSQDPWMVMDVDVSNLCYRLKSSTIKMKHRAPNFGDLRLLALNDIYLISKDSETSITKYFGQKLHDAVLASLDFDMYLPPPGAKSPGWCFDIAQRQPTNWHAAISFAHNCMSSVINEGNQVDIHVAHALGQYLPLFYAQAPPKDIEDSYVHHYLAPILQSVFSSNGRFRIHWANTQMKNDSLKPDFMVTSTCVSFPLAIVVGEFKPPQFNSNQNESDIVKIGKEMRGMLNDLVKKNTPNPVVCGVLVQGFAISTFVLDLPASKLYRMTKIAEVSMFQSLDQICNLPVIVAKLVQLNNIAVETMENAEEAILALNNHLNCSTLKNTDRRNWVEPDRPTVSRMLNKAEEDL